jgi:uncharacterized protein YndB with AHSA1/START domain
MSNAKFVYVVYIAATAEKVWEALLKGELTRQYWVMRMFRTGSRAQNGSTGASMMRAQLPSSARSSKAYRRAVW